MSAIQQGIECGAPFSEFAGSKRIEAFEQLGEIVCIIDADRLADFLYRHVCEGEVVCGAVHALLSNVMD